jgi:transposase
MPELGTPDSKQAASLAGLAPQPRDSGQHRGRRHIRGGSAILRQVLYMPPLVATRFNSDLMAKYQALLAAGKSAKVAITAVMRKLIILANASRHSEPGRQNPLDHNCKFDPTCCPTLTSPTAAVAVLGGASCSRPSRRPLEFVDRSPVRVRVRIDPARKS